MILVLSERIDRRCESAGAFAATGNVAMEIYYSKRQQANRNDGKEQAAVVSA